MKTIINLYMSLMTFSIFAQINVQTTFPVKFDSCAKDTFFYETGYYMVTYSNGLNSLIDSTYIKYGHDLFRADGSLESTTRCNESYHYTINYNHDNSIKNIVYGFGDLFGTAISYFPDGSIQSIINIENNQWHGWTIYFDDEGNEVSRELYDKGILINSETNAPK